MGASEKINTNLYFCISQLVKLLPDGHFRDAQTSADAWVCLPGNQSFLNMVLRWTIC